MKCPYCGTDNPPGEEFCINCGGALNATPPAGANVSGPTGVPNVAILSPSGNTNPGGTTAGGGSTSAYRTMAPNSQLQSGRYVVEKVLGQGGMGAAMLAKDTRVSNKLVVIKELISDSTDPQQKQSDVNNFKREVDTLAQIDHPLVPTVTDSFQELSRYFMVQEYVPGENLEDHMERIKRPMPEREALTYASQVLDILDYLSQLKPPIVHRDIKPANIIIGSKDKRAHLVDFGIARADEARNAKRKQTAALGTPGYAPPEQYQGNADSRADLYALAATLHHLLTNRDPRDYPPFIYPPARSLNKGLTADIERVLDHALQINVNNRYQKAADMKRDIDKILSDHFNVSGDTSTYMLGTSGTLVSPPLRPGSGPQSGPQTPVPQSQSRQAQQPPASPYGARQAQAPYPQPVQTGNYGRPPQQQKQRGNNPMRFSFLLLLLVVIIIAAGFFVLPRLNSSSSTASTGGATPTSTTATATATQIPVSSTGIGTTTVNGQLIGISDGSASFDTNRADGSLMKEAASDFVANDISGAQTLWRSASSLDSSDAEPLIYLENQRIKTAGSPYITFVVGTILTGAAADVQAGRDSLQGAYLAQKEFNTKNAGGIQVRLLIANAGAVDNNVTAVARQIVQAVQKDPTIVGVMGWPYSGLSQDAVAILSPAKIPMVSSTASGNALTGISPYFFRVAPPDKSQSGVGALYAQQTLNAKNVAVFIDPADAYSQSLGSSFAQQFKGSTFTVNYTRNSASSIATALQQALANKPAPDLIYFAGYSDDVSVLLKDLPSSNTLQIMGGDALYSQGGYPAGTPGLTRLHFTAFAYPDEWSLLGYASKKPAFFTDYPATYGQGKNLTGGPYGYTRAGYNVFLSFDATLALVDAAKNGLGSQTTGLTPDTLRVALSNITGANAIQGVSGQISFGPDGNPIDKVVLTMHIAAGGNQMDSKIYPPGKFLVG